MARRTVPPRIHRRLPVRSLLFLGLFAAVLAGALLLVNAGIARQRAAEVAAAKPVIVTAPIARDVRPPAGRHAIDYARIDARLGQIMARRDMVGLGIAVVEDGRLSFVKGYGLVSADRPEPVTPATVFRWASLSKGVAGTLVAELAAKGKLSLDDPVSRYSRSLKLPDGGEKRVTVAELLSHRTGIVKNAYDDRLEDNEDPRSIRRLLGTLDRYCAPGSCFTYQNVAFDAASEVVERVTGQPYAAVARSMLFKPIGMSSASTTREGLERSASWARPHRGRTVRKVEDAYYRVPAAGGVNSSVFDLGLWMRAQMGEGGAIPKKVLGEIHQSRVLTPARRGRADYDRAMERNGYGLGWREHEYAGHRLIGHRGAVDGYRSLILFDPARKTGVAMLWNSNSNRPTGLPLEILDMLYKRPAKDWVRLDD
ncbi:serine hydrolase domain-containing protein [Sphingomonas sp. 1P06PA]|uniref:serine hydrolase domain-containing protein n=1 Tax=Sphingomonas sp. 1P06PA TaxID=554121 RepID=UPI0039A43015